MSIRGVTYRCMCGLAATLVTGAALADFLSPNSPSAQNLDNFFAPPTRVHFLDGDGRLQLRPFIYRMELTDPLTGTYQEDRVIRYPLVLLGEGWTYKLFGFIPASRHLVCASSGSFFYPLGTDKLGRDLLARVLSGAKVSLFVVVAGLMIYAVLGLAVGALAGLSGGWIDSLLMRFSEFVLAVPALYVLLALRALLPKSLSEWQMLLATVGIIAALTWPPLARGARGLILQLRSATYVEAARSVGCSQWRIFARHMLPALMPYVLTQSALAAPVFLLGEIFLSFLGAGVGGQTESWGALLRDLQDLRVVTDFWWNLAPLVCVFATLLSMNVLFDRYRDREVSTLSL